jgi:peptidoglycan/xylan/chitin deacetylase (PgdA/CDA1 family)
VSLWYGRCAVLRAVNALRLVSSLYYLGLDALGIPQVVRYPRRGATILCYHNVVPHGEGAASTAPDLHMPLARFESQVRWLMQRYQIVPLRELAERIGRGEQLAHAVALTFDDGYAGTFRHAVPLLASLGIPATVFVMAEAPGRWDSFWWDHPDLPEAIAPKRLRYLLDEIWGDEHPIPRARGPQTRSPVPSCLEPAGWDAIAAAARAGLELGVHSATHRRLPRLTDVELERELVASRAVIQRETGATPQFFSYPYGLWDERVRAAVRAAGYRGAVTVDPGLNAPGADRWALRRISIPANISDPAFHAYTAGLNPRWALR